MLVLLPALLLLAASQPFIRTGDDTQTALPAPIPMPPDRAAASYQIYSMLLPVGELRLPAWPHDLWPVEDTTISVVPLTQPCSPKQNKQSDFSLNPHTAVHPPEASREDYNEILQDFDEHCHERIALDPNAWKASAPVRLMNQNEQKEFQSLHNSNHPDPLLARKYKGAPALFSFSEVYFNAHSTVALVYATDWCGNLCAHGTWIALALKDGHWQPLPWASDHWVS